MLEKDPTRRITAVQALAHAALEQVVPEPAVVITNPLLEKRERQRKEKEKVGGTLLACLSFCIKLSAAVFHMFFLTHPYVCSNSSICLF